MTLAGRTILQVTPELAAGGVERTTVDIARALVGAGARALVASAGGRLVEELRAVGGEWIEMPAASKNPLRMAANARALVALILAREVDIVHARSRAPAWSALYAARATGVPFVTTYHGSYNGRAWPKVLYNSVMARGDVVIANSGYTAGLIRAKHPFAEPRITVIHRGTDLAVFDPAAVAPERVAALRQSWGVAAERRIILLAARLTGWKGQRVLIEAAAALRARGVGDISVVLAGDAQGRASYVAELDALTARLGLGDAVRRVGHCADMAAAFAAAEVVAVPSTEPEAFGRSAIEAQAMGRPVVVSDHGAVPETVLAPPDVAPEARTGWRVPPADSAALAAALAEALTLPDDQRAALCQRARAHAALFSLQRMCAETLDVYETLLNRVNSATIGTTAGS